MFRLQALIILKIAIAVLALETLTADLQAAEAAKGSAAVPNIPVVRTWADLLKQPATKLGDARWKPSKEQALTNHDNKRFNTAVKLGIESDE